MIIKINKECFNCNSSLDLEEETEEIITEAGLKYICFYCSAEWERIAIESGEWTND